MGSQGYFIYQFGVYTKSFQAKTNCWSLCRNSDGIGVYRVTVYTFAGRIDFERFFFQKCAMLNVVLLLKKFCMWIQQINLFTDDSIYFSNLTHQNIFFFSKCRKGTFFMFAKEDECMQFKRRFEHWKCNQLSFFFHKAFFLWNKLNLNLDVVSLKYSCG